jgi:hypothetical protein
MITRDFTFKVYQQLIRKFLDNGYIFTTLEDSISKGIKSDKYIILRHDVDRAPGNALIMAGLEKEMGIHASYYFRIVSESYNDVIIRKIVDLGHELGYHYEDISLHKGNYDKAYESFTHNLEKLRGFYPIKTICMHGSPESKWDNRTVWEKYDYKKHGIICEPYFDIDFNSVFYLTDASRAWNNQKVNRRDKVRTNLVLPVRKIPDLFHHLENNTFPSGAMINIHPHNWASTDLEWVEIFLWQGFKNLIKRYIIIK